MDLVVLPHSAVTAAPSNLAIFTAFLLDDAFFVGVPIALAAKRYLHQQ